MERYLAKVLERFSEEKFVLVAGPRQVGKTTLAQQWLKKRGTSHAYLNWDISQDRAKILNPSFLESVDSGRIVLDELHKYARWKTWLKGLYDSRKSDLQCVVTGSARLDLLRKGRETLFGRTELLHLHPLSIGELTDNTFRGPPSDWLQILGTPQKNVWSRLTNRGGFPEPYLKNENQQHRRWVNQRRSIVVDSDIRDLSQLREVSLVEHLMLLLPERVGSPLSITSLKEDLGTSYNTVRSWIDSLEKLYYAFRIYPYSKNIKRSIKKESKLYLWDWSTIPNEGPRFENVVASHLLKTIQLWNDLGEGNFELNYLKDKEKKEIDFVVVEDKKPVCLIECKEKSERLSPTFTHFEKKLGKTLPKVQLVNQSRIFRKGPQSLVITAKDYLAGLN